VAKVQRRYRDVKNNFSKASETNKIPIRNSRKDKARI